MCELDSLYGVPVRQVLVLVRVLASWDSLLAASIQARYPILQAILSYLAEDMSMAQMPSREGLLLVVDSYHTWYVTALGVFIFTCNFL